MGQLSDLVDGISIDPTALLDIALTALLFYGLFSLIQGTRAVRLVIGAIVLYGVYAMAQLLDLRLLSGILQTGAVVGLLALVVIFQPELRRAWSASAGSGRWAGRSHRRAPRVSPRGWPAPSPGPQLRCRRPAPARSSSSSARRAWRTPPRRA